MVFPLFVLRQHSYFVTSQSFHSKANGVPALEGLSVIIHQNFTPWKRFCLLRGGNCTSSGNFCQFSRVSGANS